jgi:hypothetical protein
MAGLASPDYVDAAKAPQMVPALIDEQRFVLAPDMPQDGLDGIGCLQRNPQNPQCVLL